jgi:hypothetical protein
LSYARAVGLAAAVAFVAVAMSCAAQRSAPDPHELSREVERDDDVLTAEDVIRRHDIRRLGSLQEFQDEQEEMDERIRRLELEGDGEATESVPGATAEPDGFGERAKRVFETAGKVTYTVFVVAFTLGMAALPFLI